MSESQHKEEVAQLIVEYQRRLDVYIRPLIPNRQDAEEVAQEVRLFIWEHADDYQPGTNFGAWAYKIAYYYVCTYRKRQARQKVVFSDELVEQLSASAVPVAEKTDRRQDALPHCLEKLPTADRELVRVHYEAGAITRATAERVGRSLKAVYYALNRIHMNLLECIQQTLRAEEEA